LKLIYLKNSTIHTLKVTDEMLDEARDEILDIWDEIKKAFEENNFPPTKNNLCNDWCYYKPICPLFNEDAPDTDDLQNIEERITELNETLEAVEMFESLEDLPESSPLRDIDILKINEELTSLESQKKIVQDKITLLLRK